MTGTFHSLPRRHGAFDLEADQIGGDIHALAAEIYPFGRSITGNGVRQTLARLGQHIKLEVREVPTGTPVFDWTIPREWNIRDAWIKDPSGRRIVDVAASNLHVVGYSIPIDSQMTLAELRPHLHSLPEEPNAVPFRTSYWTEDWGFCLPHAELQQLTDGVYDVRIDSTLRDGFLTYGEYLHQGSTAEEVLLSAHICHPSQANDNCSGLALLTLLAARLAGMQTRLSYRFLFAPATIGALAWLAQNETILSRIKHGLVVSCVGDGGGPTYKCSRRGEAMIDRVMIHVLNQETHGGRAPRIMDFTPFGQDERQFCAPGFNLPVGLFQRSPPGAFAGSRTSLDDLDLIKPEHLGHSFNVLARVLKVLEHDRKLVNLAPKGEPQLGRRGFNEEINGGHRDSQRNQAMLWLLNFCDGQSSVLEIAERSGMAFAVLHEAALDLEANGLLLTLAPPVH